MTAALLTTVPEPLTRQTAELDAMRRMLDASRSTFSFSVAICNSPSLRDYLIGRFMESHPEIAVVSIPADCTDPYGLVISRQHSTRLDALFIIDLERIIPSGAAEQRGLRSLNAARELWEQHFRCPVVLWLPEYAATLLSIHARDLWRYRSHRFEFCDDAATEGTAATEWFSADPSIAANLTQDEKHFRIAELERRLADAGESPDPIMALHVLHWIDELVSLNYKLGRLDEAEKQSKRLVKLAIERDSQSHLATAYSQLGRILKIRGDLRGAEEMHRAALAINENLGRLQAVSSNLVDVGNVLQSSGDLDGAEAMYLKALGINDRLGWAEGIASNYGNIGIVRRIRGDLTGAETALRQSLAINEQFNLIEGMAIAYGNIGNVLQLRGDLDGAEAMQRKAIALEERLGRVKGMSSGYGNLGNVLRQRGDLDGADLMYRKSLSIEEKLDQREGIATCHVSIGGVLQRRGDLRGAEIAYHKALSIYEILGISYGRASACANLGVILQSRGDFLQSREMLTQSRDLFAHLGAKADVKKMQSIIDQLPK